MVNDQQKKSCAEDQTEKPPPVAELEVGRVYHEGEIVSFSEDQTKGTPNIRLPPYGWDEVGKVAHQTFVGKPTYRR
jgi:hypothetical protein